MLEGVAQVHAVFDAQIDGMSGARASFPWKIGENELRELQSGEHTSLSPKYESMVDSKMPISARLSARRSFFSLRANLVCPEVRE